MYQSKTSPTPSDGSATKTVSLLAPAFSRRVTAAFWMALGLPGLAVNLKRTIMALSVMPDDELPNFSETLDWLMEARTGDEIIQVPSAEWLVAASTPASSLAIHLLTRKPDAPDRVPYAFLLLSYGMQRFQVNVPCPKRDGGLTVDAPIELKPFPWPDAAEDVLHAGEMDLSGTDRVTGDTISVTYQFENVDVSGMEQIPRPDTDDVPD